MRDAPVSGGMFIKFENGIFSLHLPGSQRSGLKLQRVTWGGGLYCTRQGLFFLSVFILEHLVKKAVMGVNAHLWIACCLAHNLSIHPLLNVCVIYSSSAS